LFNDLDYDCAWKHFIDKPRNRIFIPTQEKILLYNTKTHTPEKLIAEAFKGKTTIANFSASSDSIVWMARFRNSFLRYNLNNDSYKEYWLETWAKKNQACDIILSEKGNRVFLLAKSTGILVFDEHTEKIVERITPRNDNKSILGPSITIFKDLGEYYLIGYKSKGISLYHKKNKTFRHFSQEDGLVSNNTIDAVVTPMGTPGLLP
jgi:hypothetical protein